MRKGAIAFRMDCLGIDCVLASLRLQDGDSVALLSALRIIAHIRGISTLAAEVGMTRQGLQKALSANGNPQLDNVSAIMRALGYQLVPQRIEVPVG
ncbi:MAG: putative addiction module antidote protein [Caldilinea sp. CFX5]|nr:putative addiction module antidote protein [Caldilinea sp. CFX5]